MDKLLFLDSGTIKQVKNWWVCLWIYSHASSAFA